LLGDPKWGPICELRLIYHGCRALTFALGFLEEVARQEEQQEAQDV